MDSPIQTLTEDYLLKKQGAKSPEEVTRVNLWGLQIENIDCLTKFTNLKIVSLTQNNISDLKPLTECCKLQELFLRKNQIQDLSQIEYLKNLKELKVLWVSDNPVDQHPNYRIEVIKMLPYLYKLDEDNVTPDERMEAVGTTKLKEILEEEKLKNESGISKKNNSQVGLQKGSSISVTEILEVSEPQEKSGASGLHQSKAVESPKKNSQTGSPDLPPKNPSKVRENFNLLMNQSKEESIFAANANNILGDEALRGLKFKEDINIGTPDEKRSVSKGSKEDKSKSPKDSKKPPVPDKLANPVSKDFRDCESNAVSKEMPEFDDVPQQLNETNQDRLMVTGIDDTLSYLGDNKDGVPRENKWANPRRAEAAEAEEELRKSLYDRNVKITKSILILLDLLGKDDLNVLLRVVEKSQF